MALENVQIVNMQFENPVEALISDHFWDLEKYR